MNDITSRGLPFFYLSPQKGEILWLSAEAETRMPKKWDQQVHYIHELFDIDSDHFERVLGLEYPEMIQIKSNTAPFELAKIILERWIYNGQQAIKLILLDEDFFVEDQEVLTDQVKEHKLFQTVFQNSLLGLIVINHLAQIEEINDTLYAYFDLEPGIAKGYRFGDVFQCNEIYKTDQQCGTTKGCSTCLLRRSINKVLESKDSLEGVEVCHQYHRGNHALEKWFLVNLSPLVYKEKLYVLISFVDITGRKKMEKKLEELGLTDSLTGLYNHRYIHVHLEKMKSKIEDYESHGLCVIDIDNFKSVNDELGQSQGDAVLLELAQLMKNGVRINDIAGRYGGEKFVMIISQVEQEEAMAVINRILHRFKKNTKKHFGREVSFSGGLLMLDRVLCKRTNDELFELVDHRLCQAKVAGKGCVLVFNQSIY